MSRSKKKETAPPRTGKVTFTCTAPEAKSACIAGSFNNWDPTGMPMRKRRDGNWSIAIELAPGTYEYKFLIDNIWCCEPGIDDSNYHSDDAIPNSFGTKNRTISVR